MVEERARARVVVGGGKDPVLLGLSQLRVASRLDLLNGKSR
jgi:hypothetical protein